MKIISSILFCLVVMASYAQERSAQTLLPTSFSFNAEPENLMDTTDMYNSRYGPVARLTQDNMPCIMPYAPATPIPNAAVKRKKPQPNDIPNFWKYKRPEAFPGKLMPIPESLQKSNSFKAPGTLKK